MAWARCSVCEPGADGGKGCSPTGGSRRRPKPTASTAAGGASASATRASASNPSPTVYERAASRPEGADARRPLRGRSESPADDAVWRASSRADLRERRDSNPRPPALTGRADAHDAGRRRTTNPAYLHAFSPLWRLGTPHVASRAAGTFGPLLGQTDLPRSPTPGRHRPPVRRAAGNRTNSRRSLGAAPGGPSRSRNYSVGVDPANVENATAHSLTSTCT
jgi:hypothetical protein